MLQIIAYETSVYFSGACSFSTMIHAGAKILGVETDSGGQVRIMALAETGQFENMETLYFYSPGDYVDGGDLVYLGSTLDTHGDMIIVFMERSDWGITVG